MSLKWLDCFIPYFGYWWREGGLGVGGELLTAGCVTLLIPGPPPTHNTRPPTSVTEVWNKTVQPFQRKQLDSVDYIWLNYLNISFHWVLELFF